MFSRDKEEVDDGPERERCRFCGGDPMGLNPCCPATMDSNMDLTPFHPFIGFPVKVETSDVFIPGNPDSCRPDRTMKDYKLDDLMLESMIDNLLVGAGFFSVRWWLPMSAGDAVMVSDRLNIDVDKDPSSPTGFSISKIFAG